MTVRGHRHEEHVNHEAWVIPYADLLTLLMAFFVVMYAVSVVDAGKYRILSDSLEAAFGSPGHVEPIQIGDPLQGTDPLGEKLPRSLAPFSLQDFQTSSFIDELLASEPLSPSRIAIESAINAIPEQEREKLLLEISEMAGEIESGLSSLIEDETIKVDRKPFWLEIEINTNLLFLSGSATLEKSAIPVLQDVARVLAKRPVHIHVEGHTDNQPIFNSIYPSNWELSSGRAATVVNLFAQNGIDPRRMVAIGYAEFQPLDSNATEAGRTHNRRVDIIVLPGPPPRAQKAISPRLLEEGDFRTSPDQRD